MTLNEFLDEFLDPKFQEDMKQNELVLQNNKVLEMVLEWLKNNRN
jgi:hypothetical protein